ncbi:hypothetical protein V6N12_029922 [Hibiscus sabdariffa]|uniref:Nodulin-like domain-containing protein n=1 Tax=Hibiscus sabdariffa TaxID=183260 RepID=A0ABR2CXK0_9ROSI
MTDYLRRISLKMLTMDNKPQNAIPNTGNTSKPPHPASLDSTAQTGLANGGDWQEESPIRPLHLLVPTNYPNCSPILLDEFPVEVRLLLPTTTTKKPEKFVRAVGMTKLKLKAGSRPPWVGLAAAVWVQISAGNGSTFPLYSSFLKSVLGFNQQQLTFLGVANDFGESVGLLPGIACNRFPPWAVLLVGVLACFLGYGVIWLAVTQTVHALPYWLVNNIIIFFK